MQQPLSWSLSPILKAPPLRPPDPPLPQSVQPVQGQQPWGRWSTSFPSSHSTPVAPAYLTDEQHPGSSGCQPLCGELWGGPPIQPSPRPTRKLGQQFTLHTRTLRLWEVPGLGQGCCAPRQWSPGTTLAFPRRAKKEGKLNTKGSITVGGQPRVRTVLIQPVNLSLSIPPTGLGNGKRRHFSNESLAIPEKHLTVNHTPGAISSFIQILDSF